MSDEKSGTNPDQLALSPGELYSLLPVGAYVTPPSMGPRWRDVADKLKSIYGSGYPSSLNQNLEQKDCQSVEGEQGSLSWEDPKNSPQTRHLHLKGSVLKSDPDIPAQSPCPVQPDSPSASFVFSCGHRLRPAARFCPECGKSVTVEDPWWLRPFTTTRELTELATAYENQGKYEEVESLYLRILAMREQRWSSQHPSVAQTLNNLAVLYEDQGKNVEAEPLYQRALAICEQQLGLQHPATAMVRENYQFVLQKIDLADNIAVEFLHPSAANYLSQLAEFSFEQGKYSETELLYQRALIIQEKHFGVRHPDVAQTLNNLAVFYEDQGRNMDAAASIGNL